MLPRKRHKPEEIVTKLRQVDVLVARGKSVADAVRSIGVGEAHCRWQQEDGELKTGQVKRRKELAAENTRLWIGMHCCEPFVGQGRPHDLGMIAVGCELIAVTDRRHRLRRAGGTLAGGWSRAAQGRAYQPALPPLEESPPACPSLA